MAKKCAAKKATKKVAKKAAKKKAVKKTAKKRKWEGRRENWDGVLKGQIIVKDPQWVEAMVIS